MYGNRMINVSGLPPSVNQISALNNSNQGISLASKPMTAQNTVYSLSQSHLGKGGVTGASANNVSSSPIQIVNSGGHGIQLAGLQAAVQVGQQQHSTGVQRLVAAPTRPSPHTIVQLVQTTAGSNPAGVQLVSHAGLNVVRSVQPTSSAAITNGGGGANIGTHNLPPTTFYNSSQGYSVQASQPRIVKNEPGLGPSLVLAGLTGGSMAAGGVGPLLAGGVGPPPPLIVSSRIPAAAATITPAAASAVPPPLSSSSSSAVGISAAANATAAVISASGSGVGSPSVKSEPPRQELVKIGSVPLTTDNGQDEDTPEMDIYINNVVCSFSVRCHLNLKEIALTGSNVEYRRENGMVTMKLRHPYTTASIWSSGKITCTGANTEEDAKIAARKFSRILQKLDPKYEKIRIKNWRIVNVLGTCNLPFGIKIVPFSQAFKEASYEPELHPGVTYKLKYPKATLKIFSTGSITVTAPSVANVQAAVEHIYPKVCEYQKPKDPEELKVDAMRGTKRKHYSTNAISEKGRMKKNSKQAVKEEDGSDDDDDDDDDL